MVESALDWILPTMVRSSLLFSARWNTTQLVRINNLILSYSAAKVRATKIVLFHLKILIVIASYSYRAAFNCCAITTVQVVIFALIGIAVSLILDVLWPILLSLHLTLSDNFCHFKRHFTPFSWIIIGHCQSQLFGTICFSTATAFLRDNILLPVSLKL